MLSVVEHFAEIYRHSATLTVHCVVDSMGLYALILHSKLLKTDA